MNIHLRDEPVNKNLLEQKEDLYANADRGFLAILLNIMENAAGADPQAQLERLKTLLSALDDQDSLLTEDMRSRSPAGFTMPQGHVVLRIFKQIEECVPGLVDNFEFYWASEGVRSQLRAARISVQGKISELTAALHAVPAARKAVVLQQPDKRRVFVVHGRNLLARDALFSFLRAIDLDPIEWDEAVAMTGKAAPYVGEILDHAFAQSQAAIVLLTGDDLARLGTRFPGNSDGSEERNLTPQARPNVLFEAGMALGRHPDRTIIIALGQTRSFSDILGRHIIYLSSSPQSRHDLANRLRTAGCAVKTDHRNSWLTDGDFSDPGSPDLLSVSKPDPQKARSATPSLGGNITDDEPTIITDDELDHPPTRFVLKSLDDFSLRIEKEVSNGMTGFVVTPSNDRLGSIQNIRITVRSAQSFDKRHNDFRESSLTGVVIQRPDAIPPSSLGKPAWLLRKESRLPQILVGEDDRRPLIWPQNDTSSSQKWLLSITVDAQTMQTGTTHSLPLRPIKKNIVIEWNKATNEFDLTEIRVVD